MASRLKLHEELCELQGNRSVYFNPPETVKLSYRCIVYSRTGVYRTSANDVTYNKMNEYQLVVIDTTPDCELPDELMSYFPMCTFVRSYVSNGLYHFVLRLYY